MARKDLRDKEAEFLAQAKREAGARGAAPTPPPPKAAVAAASPQPVASPLPHTLVVSAQPAARPDPALILELARAEAEQRRRSAKTRWTMGLLAVTAMALLWAVVNLLRVLLR